MQMLAEAQKEVEEAAEEAQRKLEEAQAEIDSLRKVSKKRGKR